MKTPDFLGPASDESRERGGERRVLSEEERRRWAAKTAVLVSIIFYAILILTLAISKEGRDAAKVLGSFPGLGIPPRLVTCFVCTIIYLPIPFVFWHGSKIVVRAIEDGAGIGRISLLAYLMTVGKRHPSLRRSQLVVIVGIAYVFIISFAWFIIGLMVVR